MIIITPYHGKKGDSRFRVRQDYLLETIKSVDSQAVDFFHLIIDDGSTDGFCDTLRNNITGNNRRILRREKPVGEVLSASGAVNFALDLCLSGDNVAGVDISRHDLICFIDSDDLVIDIAKRIQAFTESGFDVLYTEALLFFDDSERLFFWEAMRGDADSVYGKFWAHGKMPYLTMTWKKEFLRGLRAHNREKFGIAGVLDNSIGCGQDVDLALSTFEYAKANNLKIGRSSEITAAYRLHESSISQIRNQKQRSSEESMVIVRHFGKIGAFKMHIKRFLVRPECYLPFLMPIKSRLRKKAFKGEFRPSVNF